MARRVSARCERPPSGSRKRGCMRGGASGASGGLGGVTACVGAVPLHVGNRPARRLCRCAGLLHEVSVHMRPADGGAFPLACSRPAGVSPRCAGASARGVLFFGGFCQNMDGLAISTLSFRLQAADVFQTFCSFTSSGSRRALQARGARCGRLPNRSVFDA